MEDRKILGNVEFAFIKTPDYSTRKTPFEIYYGVNSLTPVDLALFVLSIKLALKQRLRQRKSKAP